MAKSGTRVTDDDSLKEGNKGVDTFLYCTLIMKTGQENDHVAIAH